MPRGCKSAQPPIALAAWLAGARALLDHNNLPPAVVAAVGADVMRAVQFPARLADDQFGSFQKDVASAVALPVPANTLFRECTHCFLLLIARRMPRSLFVVTSVQQRSECREPIIDIVFFVTGNDCRTGTCCTAVRPHWQ